MRRVQSLPVNDEVHELYNVDTHNFYIHLQNRNMNYALNECTEELSEVPSPALFMTMNSFYSLTPEGMTTENLDFRKGSSQ